MSACIFCQRQQATDEDWERNEVVTDAEAAAIGLDDLCWEEEGEDCIARLADSERPSSLQEALERIDPLEDLLCACKTWRKAIEDDELAGAFPSVDDKALFHAIDKAAHFKASTPTPTYGNGVRDEAE